MGTAKLTVTLDLTSATGADWEVSIVKTKIILASMAVLGLAACGQSGDNAGNKGGSTAAPGAAAVLDGPKPGLWRITTSVDAMPAAAAPTTTEVCVTQATFEAPGGTTSTPGVDCTTGAFTRNGDAMVNTTTCNMQGGMKTEVSTRVTGDFSSRYTMVATSKVTGAPMAMPDTVVTVNAERIGDCPAA